MNEIERPFTDSNLLRSFVEIADRGNLTTAAGRLNRSQSAISVQVRKLETSLDVTLFVRDGKGMALTPQGQELLPVARRVLAEMTRVKTLFGAQLKGRIKVGIPDDFDEGVLERTLVDFRRAHPNVEVLASSGCTAAFPEAISKGELDIAVCSGPEDIPGDVFLEQQPVWVCNEAMPPDFADIIPLAIINHGCWLGELPKTALDKHRRRYDVVFKCSGHMSLKAAIRAGFVVGILYEGNVEPDMKILTIQQDFPPLPRCKRSILISPNAPPKLAQAMKHAIKHAVTTLS